MIGRLTLATLALFIVLTATCTVSQAAGPGAGESSMLWLDWIVVAGYFLVLLGLVALLLARRNV